MGLLNFYDFIYFSTKIMIIIKYSLLKKFKIYTNISLNLVIKITNIDIIDKIRS
jgi:hypothetical protein